MVMRVRILGLGQMVFAALLCILNFILHMVVEENERRCCEISAFFSLSLSLFFDTYIHIHIPRRASLSTLSLTLDSIETKLIAKHNIKINCSQLVISPFFDFVYISQTNNFISLRIMVKTRKIGSATQRNRYFVPDDRSRIAT